MLARESSTQASPGMAAIGTTAAVLPLKGTGDAKHRLSGVATQPQRGRLSLAMLADMLDCLAQCEGVARRYVVTDDPQAQQLLREDFPEVWLLAGDYSLNGAAAAAAAALVEAGFQRMLFLHGDLPLITPAEVADILEAAPARGALLLGDKTGEGTNGLVLSPPNVMPAAFGPGSLARHLQICQRLELPARLMSGGNAAMDIDEEEDLRMLAGQAGRLRSAAVARSILAAQ